MLPSSAKRAADVFVSARREQQVIDGLPEEIVPLSIEDAYAIQDATISQLGPVGAWKLAVSRDGKPNRSSPLPASQLHVSPTDIQLPQSYVSQVEVEIAVRFSRTMGPREAPYTIEETIAAIGSIHPAIEILGSRYKDRKNVAPLAVIADLQSNAGIVIGAGFADWYGYEWHKPEMALELNGEQVRSASGSHQRQYILDSLTWLVNHRRSHSRPVEAEDVVITGAPNMTPARVSPGDTITATVAGLGSLTARFG